VKTTIQIVLGIAGQKPHALATVTHAVGETMPAAAWGALLGMRWCSVFLANDGKVVEVSGASSGSGNTPNSIRYWDPETNTKGVYYDTTVPLDGGLPGYGTPPNDLHFKYGSNYSTKDWTSDDNVNTWYLPWKDWLVHGPALIYEIGTRTFIGTHRNTYWEKYHGGPAWTSQAQYEVNELIAEGYRQPGTYQFGPYPGLFWAGANWINALCTAWRNASKFVIFGGGAPLNPARDVICVIADNPAFVSGQPISPSNRPLMADMYKVPRINGLAPQWGNRDCGVVVGDWLFIGGGNPQNTNVKDFGFWRLNLPSLEAVRNGGAPVVERLQDMPPDSATAAGWMGHDPIRNRVVWIGRRGVWTYGLATGAWSNALSPAEQAAWLARWPDGYAATATSFASDAISHLQSVMGFYFAPHQSFYFRGLHRSDAKSGWYHKVTFLS